MNISKYLITIVYLFFQTGNSQGLSVSGNINARYGDGQQFNNLGEDADFDYNEILVDLNFDWKSFSGWLRYEYSNPPEYGRRLNNFQRFNIQYNAKNLKINLGDIYRSWDRGMILSQFEDQQIDYDNSVRGIDLLFKRNKLEIDIIAGYREQFQSTPFNINLRKHDESIDNKLIAGRIGYKTDKLINGFTVLIANSDFPIITRGGISDNGSSVSNLIGGYSIEYNHSNWDLTFDLVSKESRIDPELYFFETDYSDFTIDSIPRKSQKGYGVYAIFNKYFENWSLTVDYKKYNFAVMNPDRRISYPYPEGSMIYQNPPLTFFEHSSTLLNRRIHQLDKNDEIGYQFNLTGVVNPNMDLLLNLSKGSRNANWYRNIGDAIWQKDKWQKSKSALLLPLNDPESNPYMEIYGETNLYLLNDKILTKIGMSRSYQSLLLLENIVSQNYDSLSYEFVNAVTLPIEISYVFKNKYSIDLKYQFQQLVKGVRSKVKTSNKSYSDNSSFFYEIYGNTTKSKKYQNVSIFQLGFQKSPNWGVNFIIEKDKYHEFGIASENLEINPLENIWKNIGFEPDLTWLSIELLLNIAKKYRFNIFYGSEKGGLQCRNGVCKVIQPFSDGIRVGLTTYF